jgi:hypothetical protein
MKPKNLISLYILATYLNHLFYSTEFLTIFINFWSFSSKYYSICNKKIARKRKGYCHHVKPPTKTSSFIFMFDNIIIHKMEQTQHEKWMVT